MLTVNELRPTGATRGLARLHLDGQRLDVLEQAAPYRLLRPSGADVGVRFAVLANISGGLVGNDYLEASVEASGDAALMLTGQSAEKAYDCPAAPARLMNSYAARDTAWLEILPKELIMFEGAKVERSFDLSVRDEAQMLCGDITILGRTHHGETITAGCLRDTWQLTIDDTLTYVDRQALDFSADAEALKSSANLGPHNTFATILYAGGQVQRFVETVRALTPASGVLLATSGFERHAVARLLSPSAPRLLETYGQLWAHVRTQLGGLPQRLPTLWSL